MPHRLAVCVAGLFVVAGTACDKSHNPLAGSPESQLSLYTASIGLANSQVVDSVPCHLATAACNDDFVYVDTYDTTRTDYPFFTPGIAGQYYYPYWAYPTDPAEQFAVAVPERLEYMRESAGLHRFRFTDVRHSVVADSSFTLSAGASTVLYLTDSLLAYYRVLAIDESTPGPADRVQLRVLNLSPDAGPLNAYVPGDTGQYRWSNLPQHVTFDMVTPYVTLDSSLVAADGNVYIKLFAGVDTAATLLTAAVPYMPGRSYHLVVEGNAQTDTLRYADPRHPGQVIPLQINPSLTARVRTAF